MTPVSTTLDAAVVERHDVAVTGDGTVHYAVCTEPTCTFRKSGEPRAIALAAAAHQIRPSTT